MSKKNKTHKAPKTETNVKPERKPYVKPWNVVERDATIELGGSTMIVKVKMFALTDEIKNKLQIEGDREFPSSKLARAFMRERSREIGGTRGVGKVKKIVKKLAKAHDLIAAAIESGLLTAEQSGTLEAVLNPIVSVAAEINPDAA